MSSKGRCWFEKHCSKMLTFKCRLSTWCAGCSGIRHTGSGARLSGFKSWLHMWHWQIALNFLNLHFLPPLESENVAPKATLQGVLGSKWFYLCYVGLCQMHRKCPAMLGVILKQSLIPCLSPYYIGTSSPWVFKFLPHSQWDSSWAFYSSNEHMHRIVHHT